MKKQLFSFACAFRGIACAACEEGHFRFELVAAFFVLSLSASAGLPVERIALLIILSACVLACELFNTALERVCDLVTTERHPLIKFIKDVSAGAVLVLSAAAAAVAALFFINADFFGRVFGFFSAYPFALIPLELSAVAAVVFVALGPVKIKRFFVKPQEEKKNN